MARALLLLSLLLLPFPARADVWTDPSFQRAVSDAALIVRARAPAEGVSGAKTVTFQVVESWKGQAPETVTVGGLHDPTRSNGASFAPGAEVLLILLRKDGALEVPTPTFGRYPIRDGVVKYATLRDTYLRLDLPVDDVRRFVRLILEGEVDDDWIGGLREGLLEGEPDAEGEALTRIYLALEVLALYGIVDDGPMIANSVSDASPFQLRISACRALGGALGRRAAGRLLKIAGSDPEPAVRTAAIGQLGRLDPPPAGLALKLAELLDAAPTRQVRFSRPNDPRLNKWPSPKAAILRVFAQRGAAPVKDKLLALVASEQATEEVFTAALKALISLRGDPLLPKELVRCFRAQAEVSSAVYNGEICAALTLITGDKGPGDDPEAWRTWANRR